MAELKSVRSLWVAEESESASTFEIVDEGSDRVRIIDSWLVADGRCRAFDRHAARFVDACARLHGMPPARTLAFAHAALRRVPPRGRWFPRLEFSPGASPDFHVLLRPAPPLSTTIRLWDPLEPDHRTEPMVKGVDLDLLASLRARALIAGADEALLRDSDGNLLEGSTTSILWWRGDTLCGPPESARVLPGITRALLSDEVAAAGHGVRHENATPRDLHGLEVWAVNALHGIRPVIAWPGSPFQPGPAPRATHWAARLRTL